MCFQCIGILSIILVQVEWRFAAFVYIIRGLDHLIQLAYQNGDIVKVLQDFVIHHPDYTPSDPSQSCDRSMAESFRYWSS